MALPASGNPISIGDIRTELSNTGTGNFGLRQAGGQGGVSREEGYAPLNQSSTSKPNASSPYSINEWYSYNHSANKSCNSGWITAPDISAMYVYYRYNITGATNYIANINFYGASISSPNIYANIYTVYPFTNTGALIGSAPLHQMAIFSGPNSYAYTMSSSSDTVHIVMWDNGIL